MTAPLHLPAPALCAVLLAAGAAAQGTVTSPPYLELTDGSSAVTLAQPFRWAAPGARFQYLLGDLRGQPLPSLRAIALRRDTAPGTSEARSVSLRVLAATTDADAASDTFDQNYRSPPTEVIGAGGGPVTINLPATVAPPAPTFAIRLPLQQTYSFAGTADLLLEFQCFDATSSAGYSLDCVDGTGGTSVGQSYYNGLVGCFVVPNSSMFDILKDGPTTAGGITTFSQAGRRGPLSQPGALLAGLSDPNTTVGGILCAPLRARPDVSFPVLTDGNGDLPPLPIAFPDIGSPASVFTQYAVLDPARRPPQLQLALSDGIRFDLTPPVRLHRLRVSSTAGAQAATGSRSALFVPVFELTN